MLTHHAITCYQVLCVDATFIGERERERVELSKSIQRAIRKELRQHKHKLISEKIEAFKDLKSIAGIKANGRRKNLTSMLDGTGNVQDSRQGIVDVFASFYEDLYKSRSTMAPWVPSADTTQEVPEITEIEIKAALKTMKKGSWR